MRINYNGFILNPKAIANLENISLRASENTEKTYNNKITTQLFTYSIKYMTLYKIANTAINVTITIKNHD